MHMGYEHALAVWIGQSSVSQIISDLSGLGIGSTPPPLTLVRLLIVFFDNFNLSFKLFFFMVKCFFVKRGLFPPFRVKCLYVGVY